MNCSTISKDKIHSIAIGGFDGIHIGHQSLIERLGSNSALIVIDKGYANITPALYRKNFTDCSIYFYKIQDIKHLEAKEFVELLKIDFPNLKKVVIGYDFRFGKDRSCGVECLRESFEEVIVVDEVKIDGVSIHSKEIREAISGGDLERVKKFLGRNYRVFGKSIKGQGLGQKSLFATINLSIKEFLLPKNGVYATKTELNGQKFDSITFIGIRETTDKNFSIETHLLDIENIDIQSEIDIEFISNLRDNRKFKSLDTLKKQIKDDIKKAKEILCIYQN